MSDPRSFRTLVERVALQSLTQQLGTDAGKRAALRFGLAFATAARIAKQPESFYNCSEGSIATCVALSIETGLMPGGALPAVWLIPRGGELQWMPSHRGLIQLAQSAGYQVRAIPVTSEDTIRIEFGEIVELVQDPDQWPTSLEELRGIAIFATRIADGARFGSAWVPAAVLRKRATMKQAGPVWREWPIEMAIKSALRFVFARGYIPVENVELDAALANERMIEAESEVVERQAPSRPITGRSALGLSDPAPALTDNGDQPDPLAGVRPPAREAMPVESEVVQPAARQQRREPPTAAKVNAREQAAMASGGTDAVRRARDEAGIDHEVPVEELSPDQLVTYSAALATV